MIYTDFDDIPKNKYQIIYADPPWSFKNYSDKWHKGRKESRWVGNKYDCMQKTVIQKLNVADISTQNSILFLWVTMPSLVEGIELIEKWGFEYKTTGFVWIKKNKVSDSFFWGMGHWTRANAELCLIATRGKPKRIAKNIHQIVYSPVETHSKKPDEIRKRIVMLMGDLPRIELFARETKEGWDSFGNEVEENKQMSFMGF